MAGASLGTSAGRQSEERARMNRSRRFRASAMVSSITWSLVALRVSSRTALTISATSSSGTLPSSSVDRAAVIPADSGALDFVAWLARKGLMRGAAQRRLSSTTVVGGALVLPWTDVFPERLFFDA